MELQKDGSLVVSDFSKGIGQSVLSEYSDMMGVNIDSNPGLASINFKFNKVKESITPRTFTASDGADIVTALSTLWYRGIVTGTPVLLTTTGTLPAPLEDDTVYYVVAVGTSTSNYRLAETLKLALAGTYINITDAGTGTHTISPITPKEITGWTFNGQSRIFALDSDQRVWFNDSNGIESPWYLIAGNTTTGDGSGIVYYKGYIVVFGNGGCDALLDIQAGTETITWTNGFDGVTIENSGNASPFLSINDGSVYFYNGASVGRYYKLGMFEEVIGKTFDPTDATTFTFVEEAIKLPYENNGYITCINELNEYIVIGTGSNKIYYWDKKSPSFTLFLSLQEKDVNSIRVIDNIAYIFMANSGNIYQANLVSSGLLLKIPEQITGEYYKYIFGVSEVKVNYSVLYKREILFSISIQGTDIMSNYLMSYNIDSKKLTKKNISSFGETSERSANSYGKIYSIFPVGDNILISSSSYDISDDAYTYAIESLLYKALILSGATLYYVYDGNEPYIITGLLSIGDVYNKKTFRELQISVARNLATGQGVSVYYRRDDNSSWTLLKTIDFATYGAIKDIKVEAPLSDVIDLQLKITLDGLNLTSPMLKLVRLIP